MAALGVVRLRSPVVAQEQEHHAPLLSRVAKVMAARRHPLVERAASLRAFLVTAGGEGGVGTIVQSQADPGISICCLIPRDGGLGSILIEIVHPDGRLERLRDRLGSLGAGESGDRVSIQELM